MVGNLPRAIVESILEAIPLELTILDENDRVIGWNTRRPRVFARPEEILGRDVRECHSEKSLGMVDRLLREMKEGARGAARFWYDQTIDGVTQKVVVDYYALRDESGRYLGCVETLLNVEPLRALEGEKRELDD